MAKPFKETPILYGKDARRFEEAMRRVESMTEEEKRTYRENHRKEYERICKEWNLTFEV